ncbi:Isochorismatase family protein [Planctomycetes bacterium Pan216]|uniref:Isochorismatase family protein n=1 Tax=Kolteria novifilia TaxID=2527975 RepID=A0A518BC76_9BACT|nr:Isochorismatase family protein [Planctomycetes bacterium Pan216]
MRSPQLMSAGDTAILLVDVQEKLLPLIDRGDGVRQRCRYLLQAARILNIPVVATEQYPKGLGSTIPELAEFIASPFEKLTFSSYGIQEVRTKLGELGSPKVLLCGIEAHVCVQQTAFDLMADGFRVYLPIDATGSRRASDKEVAIDRMRGSGITITTAEAAVFEWTERAGTPEFKEISRLVKEN